MLWSSKYDGHNCTLANLGSSYGVSAFSRNCSSFTLGVRNTHWYKRLRLPVGMAVTGELYLDGCNSSDVSSALADASPKLEFAAYALPTMPADLPLSECEATCIALGLDFVPYGPMAELPFALNNSSVPPNLEGYVFRTTNLGPSYKWKPIKTIDLVISGYTNAEPGKYAGQIGAVVCKTSEGVEIADVSGMKDIERLWFTEHRPLGIVIEVEYQEVGNKGRLRFPRFKQFRRDKTIEQCGLEQDPALLEHWSKAYKDKR